MLVRVSSVRGLLLAALFSFVLLALVATTSADAKRKPPPPPQNWWGVFGFETPSAGEFEKMDQTGIGTYRLFVYWRQVEGRAPTPIPGTKRLQYHYDWDVTDANFRRAAAAGVDLHLSIYSTPGWVASELAQNPNRTAKGKRAWKAFIGAAADRYGAGGEFWREHRKLRPSPPVAWQIWNEQNTSARFKPGARPRKYADLLIAAGEQIRERVPNARVMPGGMFGTPKTPDSMTAWKFLTRLVGIKEARPYIDAVGIHPYSPDLRGVRYQIRKMRKVLDRAGMKRTPLELTEIGWSSGLSDRFFFFKGRDGQAELLKRTMKMLLKKRVKWNIDRVIWLAWRDYADPPEGCGFCEKFGLLKLNGNKKPAYRAYAKLARRSKGR